MSPSSATSDAIGVLVVDSNRLQAQLLTSALRRHAEFHIATCSMDIASLLQAFAADPPSVALLSPNAFVGNAENMAALRHFHLSPPQLWKVFLVDSCVAQMGVVPFCSGGRVVFWLS